jgi:hypothetical protein
VRPDWVAGFIYNSIILVITTIVKRNDGMSFAGPLLSPMELK